MSGLTSPRLSTQGSLEMFCNDFSKPEVLYSADSLPDLLTEGHVSLHWSHRVIEQSVQSTVLLEELWGDASPEGWDFPHVTHLGHV